jgi:hypothetical protein
MMLVWAGKMGSLRYLTITLQSIMLVKAQSRPAGLQASLRRIQLTSVGVFSCGVVSI